MVYFQTKNPNLCKFWRVLQCIAFGLFYAHFINCMANRCNLWKFGICICTHFGMLLQEKSGNPGLGEMSPFGN
jgi:hypothetical protein